MNEKPIIHPIDVYVGRRLRDARLLRGMSQTLLGSALLRPVTFQQIQKYEQGTNQLSVSRLVEIAETLRLPISHFLPNSGMATLPSASTIKEARFLEVYRQLPENLQISIFRLVSSVRPKDCKCKTVLGNTVTKSN